MSAMICEILTDKQQNLATEGIEVAIPRQSLKKTSMKLGSVVNEIFIDKQQKDYDRNQACLSWSHEVYAAWLKLFSKMNYINLRFVPSWLCSFKLIVYIALRKFHTFRTFHIIRLHTITTGQTDSFVQYP